MADNFIMMGMGGFFLILAIIFFFWARYEQRGLNYGLAERRDLREFLTRWPMRVEPEALRVGGWLSVVIGLLLIIIGGLLLL
jgi:hypothetical protein